MSEHQTLDGSNSDESRASAQVAGHRVPSVAFFTAITAALTIFNAYAAYQNARTEQSLKDRAQTLEESKERITRYNWVRSLLQEIDKAGAKDRDLTSNLIRVVLTPDEAEQMFAGFQASSDEGLQMIGQNGLFSIQNASLAKLVARLNSPEIAISDKALSELLKDYKLSSIAIGLVLRLMDKSALSNLSANGLKSSIRFLKNSDPAGWNTEYVVIAKKVVLSIQGAGFDRQVRGDLAEFQEFLERVQ